jgi:hypothetical protein
MNSIELIVATSSVIVALTIAFIIYVLLKPRNKQIEVETEQVTINAKLDTYDETSKLKARIEFLEAEIEKFATICDGLTAANKKCLDEFEAYVKLVEGEQPKRSVTSLGAKECIEIGEGDWEKLAPLFEENDIRWIIEKKASEFAPFIDWCIVVDCQGIAQSPKSVCLREGYTILPASDFIEPQVERELSEYVAFPEGYDIPKGTRVIKVSDNDDFVRKGSIGVTLETDFAPFIKWENEDYNLLGSLEEDLPQLSSKLAPIDPTQHPNHPLFKKA